MRFTEKDNYWFVRDANSVLSGEWWALEMGDSRHLSTLQNKVFNGLSKRNREVLGYYTPYSIPANSWIPLYSDNAPSCTYIQIDQLSNYLESQDNHINPQEYYVWPVYVRQYLSFGAIHNIPLPLEEDFVKTSTRWIYDTFGGARGALSRNFARKKNAGFEKFCFENVLRGHVKDYILYSQIMWTKKNYPRFKKEHYKTDTLKDLLCWLVPYNFVDELTESELDDLNAQYAPIPKKHFLRPTTYEIPTQSDNRPFVV